MQSVTPTWPFAAGKARSSASPRPTSSTSWRRYGDPDWLEIVNSTRCGMIRMSAAGSGSRPASSQELIDLALAYSPRRGFVQIDLPRCTCLRPRRRAARQVQNLRSMRPPRLIVQRLSVAQAGCRRSWRRTLVRFYAVVRNRRLNHTRPALGNSAVQIAFEGMNAGDAGRGSDHRGMLQSSNNGSAASPLVTSASSAPGELTSAAGNYQVRIRLLLPDGREANADRRPARMTSGLPICLLPSTTRFTAHAANCRIRFARCKGRRKHILRRSTPRFTPCVGACARRSPAPPR